MRSYPFVEELVPCPDSWATAQLFLNWPHLLFLDSSDRHPIRGRYSFISADPIEWFELSKAVFNGVDPFAPLSAVLTANPTETIPGLPPFQGGLAGLFSYGLGHAFERFPQAPIDEFGVPDLAIGVYDWVIAFDHLQEKAWLIAKTEPRLREIAQALQNPLLKREKEWAQPLQPVPQFDLRSYPGVSSNFNRALTWKRFAELSNTFMPAIAFR